MDGALTVGDLKRALSYLEDDDPRTIVLLEQYTKSHFVMETVVVSATVPTSPEDRVVPTISVRRLSEPEFWDLLNGIR